jgi:hypothetical protein
MAKLGVSWVGDHGWPDGASVSRSRPHFICLVTITKARRDSSLRLSVGANFCDSPEAVARQSECVFLCVGDTAMSRRVILGPKGLVQGAQAGFVVVDCSTVSPLESSCIAKELAEKDIDFLDARALVRNPAPRMARSRSWWAALPRCLNAFAPGSRPWANLFITAENREWGCAPSSRKT